MLNMCQSVHPEWRPLLKKALQAMNPHYFAELPISEPWLPGKEQIFAAFSLPLSDTRYVLLGESPYPRAISANGYAFWDANVNALWSEAGLSREVNRATSLRNFIKMLLHARGDLCADFTKAAIAQLDKSRYIQTCPQLFNALMQQGFLLLNASLVYQPGQVMHHARQWRPFIANLLQQLQEIKSSIQLILLGRIATLVPDTLLYPCLIAEHPYNLSFITNTDVMAFFKPMDLLSAS